MAGLKIKTDNGLKIRNDSFYSSFLTVSYALRLEYIVLRVIGLLKGLMKMENSPPVPVMSYQITQPRLKFIYPQVYGLPNPMVERKINQTIFQLVQRLIAESGYYEIPDVDVTGTYEIKTNELGVLSLSIIIYWYSGGAHGMTVIKSLTFDVATGRDYSLSELFKPGSDYIRVISDQVRQQIRERQIDLFEEPFKSIRPDQDYYIADKALVVYFQLYEIAAYVFGILYFPISVYSLQDIVDENSPLGKMI